MNTTKNINLHEASISEEFSWSATFSGLLAATAIGGLFSLLGMAIGFAFFEADTEVLSALSTGTLIWFIIGGTIAMFLGGIITGYMVPTNSAKKGMIHGFIMWCLSFILGLLLTMSGVGAVVTGSSQLIGQTINISGKVVSASLTPAINQVANSLNLTENQSLAKIKKQATALLNKAAKKVGVNSKAKNHEIDTNFDEKQEQLIDSIKSFVTNTDDASANQLYNAALDQLITNTNMSRTEANQLLIKWQQTYQKVADKMQAQADEFKDQAKDAVNSTTNILSSITLSAFIAMVLGAFAAIYGSLLGVRWKDK